MGYLKWPVRSFEPVGSFDMVGSFDPVGPFDADWVFDVIKSIEPVAWVNPWTMIMNQLGQCILLSHLNQTTEMNHLFGWLI